MADAYDYMSGALHTQPSFILTLVLRAKIFMKWENEGLEKPSKSPKLIPIGSWDRKSEISDQSHFLLQQTIILSCQQIHTEHHKYSALLGTVRDGDVNPI